MNNHAFLNEQRRKTLTAVAHFRMLTLKQAIKLGLSKSETSIRDHGFQPLERFGCTGFIQGAKWLPKIHYMKAKGAKLLEDEYELEPGTLHFYRNPPALSELRTRHRIAQVDFQIGFKLWCHHQGAQAVFEAQDFHNDPTKKEGFLSATQVQIEAVGLSRNFIPDGVFIAEKAGVTRIYVLEVHRTTQTQFTRNQIENYLNALTTGAIEDKFDLKVNPFVCSVHHLPNVLEGTKAHLRSLPDFRHFYEFFVFNTMEQIGQDFYQGWTYADGKPAHPFERPATLNELPLFS